jgi:hypothetical protein
VVRLDQNSIGGGLPPSWGKLKGLRTLTLWDNKLTGGIPDSWADMQVCADLSGSSGLQQLLATPGRA